MNENNKKTGQNEMINVAKTGQNIYHIFGGVHSCLEKIPL